MARVTRLRTRNGRHAHASRSLLAELEEIGSQIARLGERSIEEGQERLGEEVGRLRANFDSIKARLREEGLSSIESMSDTIQQRPITSVAAAFTAGAAATLLIGAVAATMMRDHE